MAADDRTPEGEAPRSIEQIVADIEKLAGSIGVAPVTSDEDKFRRTRTVNFLIAIAQALKAWCDPDFRGYFFYRFPKRP